MNEIVFTEEKSLQLEELLHLYNDAKWTAYIDQADKLTLAIQQLLCVITA